MLLSGCCCFFVVVRSSYCRRRHRCFVHVHFWPSSFVLDVAVQSFPFLRHFGPCSSDLRFAHVLRRRRSTQARAKSRAFGWGSSMTAALSPSFTCSRKNLTWASHGRCLCCLFWLVGATQIFLTMRLDDDIDWSYAVVGSPLLAWMGLQLLGHLYEARVTLTYDQIH